MKGDFSRLMFDALKHYAGVLHQQGRVWLDSDWNEDVFERLKLLQSETADIVGLCGFPEPGTAFQISPNNAPGAQPDDFLIGGGPGAAGHGYVNGILCQQDDPLASYLNQQDYPNPQRIALPTDGSDLNAVVYLEVWRRLITYLEDGRIREIALGGPDTATRIKTIAQVKVAVIPSSVKDFNCPGAKNLLPGDGSGTLTTLPPQDLQPPDLCRLPDPANYTGRENRLYRVEVHFSGDVLGSTGSAFALKIAQDAALGAITLRLSRALSAAETDAATRAQTISITDDNGQSDRIAIATVAGDTITLARGLRQPFATASNATVTGGAARFKWSRDNASFALGVDLVSSDRLTLTLTSLGRDQATQLRQGDLVEICDDTSELSPAARGHLTYLTGDPDPDQLTVSLADPLPPGLGLPSAPTSPPSSPPGSPPASPPVIGSGNGHLLLRRWDGQGSARDTFSETATHDMNLGDGVHIQFGGSDLRSGDYWQFAARSADGSIDLLDNAPPAGIIRYRCPLAIVRWSSSVSSPPSPPSSPPTFGYVMQVVHDCRTIFPPLAQPSIHVTGVFALGVRNTISPLVNDSIVLLQRLLGGINVVCDADVRPTAITRAVCYVTIQIPSGVTGAPGSPASTPTAYQELVLAADATVAGNVIQWRLRDPFSLALVPFGGVPKEDPGILARLVLKGNFVWAAGNPNYFLDGDDFGFKNPDSATTAIHLPSGDRRRGGTFETWFWLSRRRVEGGPLSYTLSTSVAPIARAEGLNEFIGDLVLSGTGGNPTDIGLQVPAFNITVLLNTQITNGPATGLSDIALVIDDPATLNSAAINKQIPDPVISQTGDGVDYKNGEAPNIFRGVISSNSVTFFGVPLDPPGSGPDVLPRTLRITNIRVNASSLGVSSTFGLSEIIAVVSSNPALPINNPQQVVAFLQAGKKFELRTSAGATVLPSAPAFTFAATAGVNPNLLDDPAFRGAVTNFFVQFDELFATSFKMRRQPQGFQGFGLARNDETGFDNNGDGAVPILSNQPALPQIGVATNGTRLRVTFNGIPQDVRVFVTVRNIPQPPEKPLSAPNVPPPRALLVISPLADGSGGKVSPPILSGDVAESAGFQIVPLDISDKRSAMAVWESVNSDASRVEPMRFGIVLAARQTSPNLGLGTATVNGSLAPFGPASPLPVGPPAPRFLDDSIPLPAFAVTSQPG